MHVVQVFVEHGFDKEVVMMSQGDYRAKVTQLRKCCWSASATDKICIWKWEKYVPAWCGRYEGSWVTILYPGHILKRSTEFFRGNDKNGERWCFLNFKREEHQNRFCNTFKCLWVKLPLLSKAFRWFLTRGTFIQWICLWKSFFGLLRKAWPYLDFCLWQCKAIRRVKRLDPMQTAFLCSALLGQMKWRWRRAQNSLVISLCRKIP